MEAIAASINETAKALSLGRTSIYALIREGRLETARGCRTLSRSKSICKLIERCGARLCPALTLMPGGRS